MTMAKDETDKGGEKPQAMTAAQAARLVTGKVRITGKDGKPAEVPVSEQTILSFRDYGDRVVVVTIDGQKLEGRK